MKKETIINKFIKKRNYNSYLEIGTGKGNTFRKVVCRKKIGVDVEKYPVVTHTMNSDTFFNQCKATFDIIFIDGFHEANQVHRDILNALSVLNKKGVIICHDMNPTTKEMQVVPRQQGEWTGDGWRAWVQLRQTRDDLKMCVVDTDYGVGIIKRGKQKLVSFTGGLTYEKLSINREKWLNLISVESFLKKYI